MINIVFWLWSDRDPRRAFVPEQVNVQRRSFAKLLSMPHRIVCVTDEPATRFDDGICVVPTPEAAREAGRHRNPEGARFPSCYRRLWTWSREASAVLGERVLLLDIDLVLLRDISGLLARPESFVGWRPRAQWGVSDRVGGGMYLLTTGAHPEVWDGFEGATSIARARKAGYRGSDQAWISFCMGPKAALFPGDCGLYSIRDMKDGREPLPADARLVQFNGPQKPWTSTLPWVRANWQ